jgi:hypothetical protein
MPAEVFFDVWKLQSPAIEAWMPGEAKYLSAAYPHPYLAVADGLQTLELPIVILENDACRLTICPALGGRLVGWFDKRLQRSAIRLPEVAGLVAEGPRGAWWPYGIRLETLAGPLPTDLASVNWQAVYPAEDDDPAGVWLGNVEAERWSWHLAYALDSDRPLLSIDVRIQNRTPVPLAIDPVLSVFCEGHAMVRTADRECFASFWNDGMLLLEPVGDVAFETTTAPGPGRVLVGPTPARPALGPYQSDTWAVSVRSVPGLGKPWHIGPKLSIGMSDDSVMVYAEAPIPDARISVQLSDGSAQSAPAALVPEQVWTAELGDLAKRVAAIGVEDADGTLLAIITRPEAGAESTLAVRVPEYGEPWRALPPELCLRTPGRQHAALIALADDAILQADWTTAQARLERATGYQGEDALTWWRLALTHRYLRRGEGRAATEPDAALDNAFYLAPLEPRLRAEQFLTAAEDASAEADPTGLLKPLAATPLAFVDVAQAYLDFGLTSDALLWLTAALEFADLAILRALRAATYLELGLEMEAMADAQHADRNPVQPPFPSGLALDRVQTAALRTRGNAFTLLVDSAHSEK